MRSQCKKRHTFRFKVGQNIPIAMNFKLDVSCHQRNVKGIKNGCPCIVEIRGTQGCALVGDPARAVGECRRSQGTTLSASDLHNARATILNPFYNMEYKVINKIRQNTTWIEADILGKNLTPNWCNAFAPAIVYVSNDVTIPFNAVTSQ